MPTTIFPGAKPGTPIPSAKGEMLRLINDFDWSKTPLGPMVNWPSALTVTVRVMLASHVPMVMLMGPDGVMVYNDAYSVFAGKRHPFLLGSNVLEGWAEVADFNRHVMDVGLRGETLSFENQQLTLYRNNVAEEVWMNLDYSPVLGEDGKPLAVLAIVYDTTKRVAAERALARSEESLSFALTASGRVGVWDWDVVNDQVTSDARFAEMYGVDPKRAAAGAPIGEFIDGVHPDDRAYLTEEIEDALQRRGGFRAEYRLLGRDGQVRWVLALGRATADAGGKSIRLPGVVVDITERKVVEAALAESEAKFRAIADTMPQMVWSALPDGYHDYHNARWYEFTGLVEGSDTSEWRSMFHPDDRARARELWQESLRTGEPYQIEYRLRHRSGEYRWTLGRALPIRDEKGQIVRWFGTLTDIHEAKIAAEEREVIAQELSHRIKNIFSVLNGIVGLSARNRPEMKDFSEELRARIRALGKAHDFVRPHSAGSLPGAAGFTVRNLLAELLSPYQVEGRERFDFSGDDATIDDGAATPLALLFHELGTNSAKYGALARAGGRIAVEGGAAGDFYRLVWKERGGDPVGDPAHEGFGTRLITLSVEGQLGGALTRRWEPDGLRAEIVIPRTALTRAAKRSEPA